jgi:hypothetical protein
MMSVTATTAAVPVVTTVMRAEVVAKAGVDRLTNGVMIGVDVEKHNYKL